MAADNKSLGRFILDGIPPAPRGMPQVEVTFDLDASGILNVKAKDKASGKEQTIKIQGSTGLSKDEVEKMTKEAELHRQEDEEKKAKIEARNQADSLIFTAEKSLKDAGDKVAEDTKKEVEEKIASLKEILETGSKEEIETRTKELSETLSKVGEAMYKEQQSDASEPTAEEKKTDSTEPKEGETVEGEVVDDGGDGK